MTNAKIDETKRLFAHKVSTLNKLKIHKVEKIGWECHQNALIL